MQTGNCLLALLPRRVEALVRAVGESVELRQGDLLQLPGMPIEHVYFPASAVVSFLSEGERGRVVEVASVGREGFTGAPLMLGGVRATASVSVQLAGTALRLSAATFQRFIDSHDALHRACLRSTDGFLTQVISISACNASHPLSQRCARWLLTAHDRVGTASMSMTQAYLAMLLGARRFGVTTVLAELQRAGLVRLGRGRLALLEPGPLELLACRCAQAIRERQMLEAG